MIAAFRQSKTLEHAREVLVPWLLSISLALGPIYWLPGLSASIVLWIIWAIFLVAVSLVFVTELLQDRRPFPSGWLGPLGFIALFLLWIPGLTRAFELSLALNFILRLNACALFFWCFYCLAREGGNIGLIFRRAFVILVCLSAITLLRVLLNTADWQTPCLWHPDYIRGFSLRINAQSVTLAFFVPLAALMFLSVKQGQRLRWRAVGILGLIVLLGSQLVSGGRLGILASLMVLAAFLLLRSTRRLALAVILVFLLISPIYLNESCIWHFRLQVFFGYAPSRIEMYWQVTLSKYNIEVSDAIKLINEISSRRIHGYLIGLNSFLESPLLGHGVQQVMLSSWDQRLTEIHNFWLKWAVYTGIAAPLLFLFMVALILRAGWRLFRDKSKSAFVRESAAVLLLILLVGLFISMLEVNYPLEVFPRSGLWWAAAGVLVGTASRRDTWALKDGTNV